MPLWGWILIGLGVLVVVAIAWGIASRQRTQALREQFGPEYDRTLERSEGRRDAEEELRERRERRSRLEIRPLPAAARQRYADAWADVQARFVDDPNGAFEDADALVTSVMRERGYPMEDFNQRVADISVDHPGVVEHYREAHLIAEGNTRGDVTTEDLRRGMVHYRALFEELLAAEEHSRAV